VELYAYLVEGVAEGREVLIDALADVHGVDRSALVDHLYVHAGEDVARHLARVTSGLDSLVLGEAEILGQVRTAFEDATQARTAGPVLELLFRSAVTSGRRARTETAIGANPATASSMALSLAQGVLGDLRERHALVVGAGRMGLQSLKALFGRGVAQTAVANRSQDRALRPRRFSELRPTGWTSLRTRSCGQTSP
jgi:glutamyl-tRNA reductase